MDKYIRMLYKGVDEWCIDGGETQSCSLNLEIQIYQIEPKNNGEYNTNNLQLVFSKRWFFDLLDPNEVLHATT